MAHVDLLVDDQLLDQLPAVVSLLHASEVSRTPAGDQRTAVTLDLRYAPEGAQQIDPVFESTPEGVQVQSIRWHYPNADPDDPPTMCWHTEVGSPCDWDICQQPERLLAGDTGTDPALRPR